MSTSVYLDDTLKACEYCGEKTARLFRTECMTCEQDMLVCHDCLNLRVDHDNCPEEDE